MKNFEAFSPADWQESGMITHLPLARRRTPTPARRTGWKALVVVSAMTLGVTASLVLVRVPTAASAQMVRREAPIDDGVEVAETAVVDEVPVGYWPKMVRFVKSRPPLPPDDDIPDPEPLL